MGNKKNENPKLKAVQALLDNKDIFSISQLVKKKHITIEDLGRIMGKSTSYAQQCLDNPGRLRVEDLAAIATKFDLTKKYIIEMALSDYMGSK